MKLGYFCLPLFAIGLGGSAFAQSAMADAIGQAIAGRGGGPPDACYDGTWAPKPEGIAKASTRADKAFREYLALAAANGNMKSLFYGKQNWSQDGAVRDATKAVDPGATRIARIERTSLTVANAGSGWFRGTWNVYSADGSLLGTYDASLQAGRGSAGFESLALYSPSRTNLMKPIVPFCRWAGDIEFWKKAKADDEATAAPKRAKRARN